MPATLVESFTGTSGSLLTAHTSDSGHSWACNVGDYFFATTGDKLQGQASGTRRAYSSAAIPSSAYMTATLTKPTSGTAGWRLLIGARNSGTGDISWGAAVDFESTTGTTVREYTGGSGSGSFTTIATISASSPTSLTSPITIDLVDNQVTVNGVDYALSGTFPVGDVAAFVLYAGSDTQAQMALLDYLEMGSTVASSDQVGDATGLDAAAAFGIGSIELIAEGLDAAATFGTPADHKILRATGLAPGAVVSTAYFAFDQTAHSPSAVFDQSWGLAVALVYTAPSTAQTALQRFTPTSTAMGAPTALAAFTGVATGLEDSAEFGDAAGDNTWQLGGATGLDASVELGAPGGGYALGATGLGSTFVTGAPVLTYTLGATGVGATAAFGVPKQWGVNRVTGIVPYTAIGHPTARTDLHPATGIDSTAFGEPSAFHTHVASGADTSTRYGTPLLVRGLTC